MCFACICADCNVKLVHKNFEEETKMEKRFYKSAGISADDQQIRLDHFIISEECKSSEYTFGITSYGVEVQKVVGQNVQSVTVYDICCSEEKIIELSELLCNNIVMPVSVCDIVTDLLEDKFFEVPVNNSVIAS